MGLCVLTASLRKPNGWRHSRWTATGLAAGQRYQREPCSGCLQLLEILEISWNLKTLLEILEISWNLNGPPGNFCVMIIVWLMALLHDDVALFVH